MQLKSDPHIFSGMQRDMSISKQKAESLYDAKNLRFTARDGDTMLSITNEKGTTEVVTNIQIEGKYLGHCVVDDYVVLFTHETGSVSNPDHIYKITSLMDATASVTSLYNGDLNFSTPIETLGVYENDNIQKVYWTDGVKQPRVINVTNVRHNTNDNTQFDFVATLSLLEEVSITRIEGKGVFAPGTIQYSFSYYNKYGRQSNIFYTTLLHYISYPDRGGSPEDRIANCFKIKIENLEVDKFDYLRVYSIHRTSENAVPTAKKVIDIELATLGGTTATFIDDGQLGDTIDPTELLYIGGEEIVAQTITQKDNTLFLGNINLARPEIDGNYKQQICALGKTDEEIATLLSPTEYLEGYHISKLDSSNDYYQYVSSLDWASPGFKNREHYRLGVQFQHKSGKWSEPIFIGDYVMEGLNNPSVYIGGEEDIIYEPCIRLNLPLPSNNNILKEYIRVRPLVVFPTIEDRLVLTQGILCPTVFNKAYRRNSSPFAQSSWFFRPSLPKGVNTIPAELSSMSNGVYAPYRHLEPLSEAGRLSNNGKSTYKAVEIQGSYKSLKEENNNGTITILNDDVPEDKQFFVDQSIVTMHSPEIEWDTSFDFLNYTDWKLRIVGATLISATCSDVDIQTSTPQNLDAKGFIRRRYNTSDSYYAGGMFISGLLWEDYLVARKTEDAKATYYMYGEESATTKSGIKYNYLVYPWQRSGSLNNDELRGESGSRTAQLKTKKMSNLKFSGWNKFFNANSQLTYNISQLQLFSSDQVTLTKIPLKNKSVKMLDLNYYGNVDTLLSGNVAHLIVSDNEDINNCKSLTDVSYVTTEETINAKKNNILYSGSTPVRMKYKSTRHLVFGLTPNSDLSVNILPRASKVPDDSSNAPDRAKYGPGNMFWVDKSYRSRITTDEENKTVVSVDIYDDYQAMDVLRDIFPPRDKVILLDGGQDGTDIGRGPMLGTVSIVDGEYVVEGVTAQSNTYYIGTYYWHTGVEGPIKCFVKGSQDVMAVIESEMPDTPVTGDNGSLVYPYKINQQVIPNSGDINNAYLLLAELYREPFSGGSVEYPYFSGKSDEATKSNLWIPAGESVLLSSAVNNKVTIKYTQGDTWYTRYDCLKTYPFTMEDENSIVEICSFLCESRVNGDGRYDRNRGQVSNLVMSPTNFNLLNGVYNNRDNFFNYRILDRDYYSINKFSNQITWSKEKANAADIDLWTNITMANTFDLDGTMGSIEALRTWQDIIYCFQDNAISVISFNPRVQVPTNDGVPIEISNSYKLEGKYYISDSIGCKNKQTIAVTPSGLYFIDPNSKEFYHLAGKELSSVSTTHGFSNWFKNNELTHTFYDKNRNDVYVLNDADCIVYSELLGQFTSFMDYYDIPAMFNVNDRFFTFKDVSSNVKLYSMFTGRYNYFFNDYKPYWLEFISNADSSIDKTFSTIETRVDFRELSNNEWQVVHNEFFDTLQAENEYQKGVKNLSKSITASRADAKKKFRVWRVDIPRDTAHPLHRIRNTWAKIKFTKDPRKNQRMELHDVNVQYFI